MSDGSSDEELSPDWIPYCRRKDWVDVTPLEQDDGENPVVVIAYSEKFKDVYDYLRAIIANEEKSERALELTKDALSLNTANYTVWQYRRDILKALNSDLSEELDYVERVIKDNPKNYQVWHHRRVIVEWMDDPSRELELTEAVLQMDAKNYHAWQHRQWAIKAYDLFDDELQYVDRLISEDLRNNSAWNQRYFVLNHFGFTTEVLQREVHYAMNRIRIVKNNESVWNFLRGLLKQGEKTLDQFPEVVEFVEELYNCGNRSPYLIAFLIDLYEEKSLRPEESNREDYSNKVFDLCKAMANEHDVIRKKYWEYLAERLKRRLTCMNNNDEQDNESNNGTEENMST
uniref:Protein farnesyltransferase/geranylgeranyltransferase type-1 subunit alpha n=1 Tax=Tabanus bromius TaxID=304241 RepID=A0A0K8TP67_TABBR